MMIRPWKVFGSVAWPPSPTAVALNPMTDQATIPRGTPVPTEEARKLRQLTRAIRNGEAAADERALLMVDLNAAGYSYSSIASVLGIKDEAVRKACLRRTTGYGPDEA